MWAAHAVQILRFAEDEGDIRRGDRYLVIAGDERAREFVMPLSTDDVLDYLDDLRYQASTRTEEARARTRAVVTDAVTSMLEVPVARQPLQVDLVVNAKEIAALPFESALGDDRLPLLVRRDTPVILTRRIRGDFVEHQAPWPAKPKVLFVAAQPRREVPLEQHLSALRDALAPWVEPLAGVPEAMPDERRVLTRCVPATIAGIAELCRNAEEPFTHVHILAHGVTIADGRREKFGLELASEDGTGAVGVSAEELVDALGAGGALPTVVTLAACDSGNEGSTSVSGSSPAHTLHAAGIPVVLASQFPLTWEGSSIVLKSFYGGLLAGTDVRDAIHRARRALHDHADTTEHDWMSLIAFVRMPEGYADQLLDVALAADLAALETAQSWAKHLIDNEVTASAEYDKVIERLEARVKGLSRRVDECEAIGRPTLITESRGLLASAHKRLAELLFRRAAASGGDACWLERSRHALAEAARCYAVAFADDLSDHWVGVQALSLEAVAHGRIEQPWRWHAAMHAATPQSKDRRDEIWRCGSRTELSLLAAYAGERPQPDAARAGLARLLELSAGSASFEVVSTRRQLERYTEWWTTANGFFGDSADLEDEVQALLRGAGIG